MMARKALGLVLAAGLLMGNAAHAAEKAAADKGKEVKVDVKASKIAWTGRKVTGSHVGTVAVKEGSLWIAQETLTGGRIVVDMTTIKNEDLTDAESNGKLVGHLKSDDFFGVDKHPTATFVIDSIRPIATPKGPATHDVSGQLTIKGQTHPLTFPARVDIAKNKIVATADGVKIDRTKYDIRYGSGKFFQNLGDRVINDDFLLDLKIVANR